jgi:hypothetical protein
MYSVWATEHSVSSCPQYGVSDSSSSFERRDVWQGMVEGENGFALALRTLCLFIPTAGTFNDSGFATLSVEDVALRQSEAVAAEEVATKAVAAEAIAAAAVAAEAEAVAGGAAATEAVGTNAVTTEAVATAAAEAVETEATVVTVDGTAR